MATLSGTERQLAEDFFLALQRQGINSHHIETVLKAGRPTIATITEAIIQAVKSAPPLGSTVTPYTEFRRERLSARMFEALKRSHIGNFGVLQCLSPSDIDRNCRTIGLKTIEEIRSYAARHGCRLREEDESVGGRIKEVFGSVKTAPAILAMFYASIDKTDFDRLCARYSVIKLGEFAKIRQSALEDMLKEDQAKRLVKLLKNINISLK